MAHAMPASASHPRSTVNEPFSRFIINGLIVAVNDNAMKNTMFKKL